MHDSFGLTEPQCRDILRISALRHTKPKRSIVQIYFVKIFCSIVQYKVVLSAVRDDLPEYPYPSLI